VTPAPGGLGWRCGALHDAARLPVPAAVASCVPAHETPVQTDMYKSSRSAVIVTLDMVSVEKISCMLLATIIIIIIIIIITTITRFQSED
jgi:hypothetical protein